MSKSKKTTIIVAIVLLAISIWIPLLCFGPTTTSAMNSDFREQYEDVLMPSYDQPSTISDYKMIEDALRTGDYSTFYRPILRNFPYTMDKVGDSYELDGAFDIKINDNDIYVFVDAKVHKNDAAGTLEVQYTHNDEAVIKTYEFCRVNKDTSVELYIKDDALVLFEYEYDTPIVDFNAKILASNLKDHLYDTFPLHFYGNDTVYINSVPCSGLIKNSLRDGSATHRGTTITISNPGNRLTSIYLYDQKIDVNTLYKQTEEIIDDPILKYIQDQDVSIIAKCEFSNWGNTTVELPKELSDAQHIESLSEYCNDIINTFETVEGDS